MASFGGRRSVDKTADIECYVQCDPCSNRGSEKEASTYCGQCEEYMCVSCTSAHNSFRISRDHVCTPVTGRDLPLCEESGQEKPALSHCSEHVDPPLSDSPSTGSESGRKPVFDMEVVSSTEINVPSDWITGAAVMVDGRIILVDRRNWQIILLHQDFAIQSALTLPGCPEYVAVYGDNAAFVTMPDMHQLQYIHVDTTLRAGHTIPTGPDCYGVAVHDGKIYVTVSGRNDSQVRVLDTRGKVMQSIGRRFGGISYITVGRGGTLYISDCWGGHITCYTSAGDVVYGVQHENMSGLRGLTVDEEDNLFVCCEDSSDIHVLGKDGAHRSVILSSADGVVRPVSVSYRRSDQTLIVTMRNTPSCRAYKLK